MLPIVCCARPGVISSDRGNHSVTAVGLGDNTRCLHLQHIPSKYAVGGLDSCNNEHLSHAVLKVSGGLSGTMSYTCMLLLLLLLLQELSGAFRS